MKTGRGKHLSRVVEGSAASGARKPSNRRHTEWADTSALLDLAVRQRRPAVLHAMPTIRWLLTMHRFQVDAYSDEAIADALLETCPRPDDFWLRAEHLALAVQRASTARKPA